MITKATIEADTTSLGSTDMAMTEMVRILSGNCGDAMFAFKQLLYFLATYIYDTIIKIFA